MQCQRGVACGDDNDYDDSYNDGDDDEAYTDLISRRRRTSWQSPSPGDGASAAASP